MKTWLHHHRFAWTNACKRIAGQPASIFMNGLVIAIALALPALGYTVLRSVQPVAKDLAADPEITVFMKLDATQAELRMTEAGIRTAAGSSLQSLRIIGREEALAALKSQPSYADVLTVLPTNPLPDAVLVRLVSHEGAAEAAQRLAQAFRAIPTVDHVQIDSAWVRRLEAGLRFLRLGLWMLALSVGVAVIAVAFNTIRLQALTQREEVEVSQLIGATGGFIRRPFLYLGAMQGLIGGAIALGLLTAALWPLDQAVFDLARAYGSEFRLTPMGVFEAGVFLSASLGLGWIGAALSLRHHLRASAG